MDNASNNDTMVEHLEELLWHNLIRFNPSYARMRCMPHTVHLAALEVFNMTRTHPLVLIKLII